MLSEYYFLRTLILLIPHIQSNAKVSSRADISSSERPLVKACHWPPSSHTQLDFAILPRGPRGAAFKSSSQSRTVLGCVASKNAKKSFLIGNFRVLLASLADFFRMPVFGFRARTNIRHLRLAMGHRARESHPHHTKTKGATTQEKGKTDPTSQKVVKRLGE